MKNTLVLVGSVLSGVLIMVIASNLTAPKTEKPLIEPTTSQGSLIQSSFSLEKAPSESLKAQISAISGKILYQSRVATEPVEVKSLDVIQQGEKIVTDQTGEVKARIPGQLSVSLSPKSDLEFTQTLPQNIVLSQDKGQVEYLRTGQDPVSIRSNDLLVEMDGSDLIISINDGQSRISVESLKGNTKIGYNDANEVSTVKNLSEGDTLIFNEDTKTARII